MGCYNYSLAQHSPQVHVVYPCEAHMPVGPHDPVQLKMAQNDLVP
ncbi:hypothetical protein F383_27747 [Gossypium arboreum]|uniref:Uncharacterized protein n=1 Tax=Gossypium arboreum TaxID=29729 RepID=A0A0B0PDN1_GOSAR|nr:hypothetical protein F383_27747 [Gossypium arboreum]